MADVTAADSIRLVVVDDHPMFRAGVVASLADVADVDVGQRQGGQHSGQGGGQKRR